MALVEPIRVQGLRELRQALRDVDSDLGPALRKALNAAGETIVENTPPWMPKKTGLARNSVKVRSTQREARVVEGGNRAPWVPWLDFGGKRPKDKDGRPFRKRGRFIYTTYGKRTDEITETLNEVLVELARGAGFEVSSDG